MEEKAPSLVVAEAVEARVHPAPAAQPVTPSSAPQALPRGRRVGEKDHAPSPRDSTPAPARRNDDHPAAKEAFAKTQPAVFPTTAAPAAAKKDTDMVVLKADHFVPVKLQEKSPVAPAPSAPATHKRSWVRDTLLVVAAVAITFAVHYLKIF